MRSLEHGVATARLPAESNVGRMVLARAERDQNRLILNDDTPEGLEPALEEVAWRAPSTLVLWLALQGWPLVRSAEAWERHRHSDFGFPEALAYKIVIWEAWAHERGHRVDTARIPGLHYASWQELQAEWNAPRDDAG